MTDLKPCPFCGSEFQDMYVSRIHPSWIKCSCGAKIETETHGCYDPSLPNVAEFLFEHWNKRVEE